jgi:hypothetical protein
MYCKSENQSGFQMLKNKMADFTISNWTQIVSRKW